MKTIAHPGLRLLALGATVCLLTAGCTGLASRETRLPTANGVFLARLDPDSKSRPRLVGYTVVSGWTQLGEADATRIANAIDRQLPVIPKPAKGTETVRLLPLCLPRPGLGVRITTDSGSRDVAVCLGCGIIVVTDAIHHGEIMAADPETLQELKALFEQLYPGPKGT